MEETLNELFNDASGGGAWREQDHERFLRSAEERGIDINVANDFAFTNKGVWRADEYLDDYLVKNKYNNNQINYGNVGYNSEAGNISYTPANESFYNQYHTNLPTEVEQRDLGFTNIYQVEDEEDDSIIYTYGTRKIQVVARRNDGKESVVKEYSKEFRLRYNDEEGVYNVVGEDARDELDSLEDDAWSGYQNEKNYIPEYSRVYNEGSVTLNDISNQKITEGRSINSAYETTVQQANASTKGQYLTRSGNLENLAGIPQSVKDNIKSQYRSYYLKEVVTPYDTSITAKPPTGTFNANYYLNEYSDIKDYYEKAQDDDNLDIIGTYVTPEIFAEGHYTSTGRYERRRANEDEDTTIADAYTLKAPTDDEIQQIRDRQLGITATPQEPIASRLKKEEIVNNLWEEVKSGSVQSYNERAEENGFNYESFQDFVVAFLTSNDEADVELRNDLVTAGILEEGEETITDIEDALERAAGDDAREQVKDFGALAENVLRDTLDEIEKAKAVEAKFDMYSGFDSFGEITNPGAGLANSILGDSGIGGYMGFLGGPEYGESLEEGINGVFGLGNIAEKNWQDWFDKTLTEKYAKEYDNLFRNLEVKRNILEAAAPNERDYVAYVNASPDLTDDYFEYVKSTPEDQRKSKAEWGKDHYQSIGKDETERDVSMLKKKIYDPETGEFTKDFLDVSFFENTKDVEDYLIENDEADLLAVLKDEEFDSFSLEPELEAVTASIEAVDKEEYDLILDSVIGEEQIDAQFARDFINDYLKPRFDQSKSMAEFRDYINVDPDVQSPFQTQNIVDALKATAQMRADAYLEEINGAIDQNFNADFYFDPTEGYEASTGQQIDARSNLQKSTVENDYQTALRGETDPETGIDWVAEMYRYGVPVTYTEGSQSGYYDDIESIDKEQFARMHYDVKGSKGITDPNNPDNKIVFRPALNVADPARIKRYIYYEVMPLLEEEAVDIGTVFGEFVTPEEFADDVLSTYNLENEEELKKLLEQYGLSEVGSLDEVKDQLIEAISSNDAIKIREGIKYMNEQGLRPDQQNLGVQYIEREEDYKADIKGTTELFKIFKSAGFKGTQSEFYDEFLPDQDPEELTFLEDALDGLAFDEGDFSDPFSAMVATERFFPDDEKQSLSYSFGGQDTDDISTRYSDRYKDEAFFNTGAGYNTKYDSAYSDYGSPSTPKSKSGTDFLNEFTYGFRMGSKYK